MDDRGSTLGLGDGELDDTGPAAETPRVLGRYVVLELIGRGGMAEVYAAYDRELDRKVALKLLAPSGRADPAASARLVREAQALARLKHPNVVTVHDVGTSDGVVHVAMELVDGGTLRDWLAGTPRPWREVLRHFVEAGRGLRAAHAAGLVHRDFKPSNVLLDGHGVARVADFGLARRLDTADDGGGPPSSPEGSSPLVTSAGAVLGTPAYMAPEQHEGRISDERSDQYSFCASLLEALAAGPIFAGRDVDELLRSKLAGPPSPPRRPGVPAWLTAAAARGLAPDPTKRWPSMDALLTVLERRRARWHMRAAVGLGAVALAAAAGWSTLDRPDPCAIAPSVVWSDEARAKVRAAFAASGVPYAEATLATVERGLDRYAGALVGARREACIAVHEQGARDGERREACLADREREVRSLIGLLGEGQPPMVQQAVRAVEGLSELGSCAEAGATLVAPASPQLVSRVEAVRARLAQLRALRLAGRAQLALAEADVRVAEARATGYRPLLAEALNSLGSAREDAGDLRAAEEAFEEAFELALATRHDTVAYATAVNLAVNVGRAQGRPVEGNRWCALGEAMFERRAVAPEQGWPLAMAHALVAQASQRFIEAEGHARRALALLGRGRPDAVFLAATVQNSLANALSSQGRLEDADQAYAAAEETLERVLGASHPQLAMVLANRAEISVQRGALEDALATLLRARGTLVAALGSEHPRAAFLLSDIARVENKLCRHADAAAHAGAALAALERRLGPGHVETERARSVLAEARWLDGQSEAAVAGLEEAVDNFIQGGKVETEDAIHAMLMLAGNRLALGRVADAATVVAGAEVALRAVGLGSDAHAHVLVASAVVALARGDAGRALADGSLALAVLAATSDRTELTEARTTVGRALLAHREREAAVALLERNVAELGPAVTPEVAAEALFALAGARGRNDPRAVELAREARRRFHAPRDTARVEAWLGSRALEDQRDRITPRRPVIHVVAPARR